MDNNILTPRQALSKAYLKQGIGRQALNTFKDNLNALLAATNDRESEEHNKNNVADFLKNTWYNPDYYINTHERKDLVVHNGKTAKDKVGVIIEAKSPANKAEMATPDNLNTKAMHELLLYYLRERVDDNNTDLKHLVVTNVWQWLVFDAQLFEKVFFADTALKKEYTLWRNNQKTSSNTDLFYKEIAKPAIAKVADKLQYVLVDLKQYQTDLAKGDAAAEKRLAGLYKLLSPQHLLKQSFANDSNSLNTRFYAELLHIMGLEEVKDGGKKLIQRLPEGKRLEGSMLENTINYLHSRDRLNHLNDAAQFGSNYNERLFGVALELCITWLNRILFLKLLEAQLVRYHGGDRKRAFLNADKVRDYDELAELFFEVLAIKVNKRGASVTEKFGDIPYLNSSLFEVSGLEDDVMQVNNLKIRLPMPLYSQTVLKDGTGKRKTGEANTLHYLFDFLDAYNFASDGGDEVQDDNKTLINASVLGLIFEKINGYRDGSFFTPSFITMYMCRETLRRAALQKFNEAYGLDCANFADLRNYLGKQYKPKEVLQHNQVLNGLKVCDPAVGSGHFLVSALNELIAIKSDLGILADADGQTLDKWQVLVENDELVVYDDINNELFEYHAPVGKRQTENQRIQETLFNEKQTLIENCLFGVDINPNSVKICRLRLWIELLKNAYYTPESDYRELETLPNIDINIKRGNSLVSRFGLDEDLTEVFKKDKFTLQSYRHAVAAYKETNDKAAKEELLRFIKEIKEQFKTAVHNRDPLRKKLSQLRGELALVQTTNIDLFGDKKLTDKQRDLEVTRLKKLIAQREQEIDDVENNATYRNAFEWRFEFPEVLDDNGNFIGFDVVIGNPPYIRQEELTSQKDYLKQHFKVFAGTADLYVYFVELGMNLLKPQSHFIFILPNKWMRANYGLNFRKYLKATEIIAIEDFGDLPVFDQATTYPCLLQLKKAQASKEFIGAIVDTLEYSNGLADYLNTKRFTINTASMNDDGWNLSPSTTQNLLEKLKTQGIPLGEYVNGKIFRGVLTGLNEAFVIDEATRNRLIEEDSKSAELIRPFLAGRDIKRYVPPTTKQYIILIPKGFTIKSNKSSTNNMVNEPPPRYGDMPSPDAWYWFKANYPAIASHLLRFREMAEKRTDKGDFWWELRACDYYDEFEKPKIILPDISLRGNFTFDNEGQYIVVNTAYFIGSKEKFLLGLLCSETIQFVYKMLSPAYRGGYLRFIYQYLVQLPIITPSDLIKNKIESLVDQILAAKQANPAADTTALEAEIDQLVYQLYGLTEEEIKIVEGVPSP